MFYDDIPLISLVIHDICYYVICLNVMDSIHIMIKCIIIEK